MNLDVRRPTWAPRRLGRGESRSRRFAFLLASLALLLSSIASLAPLPAISPVETASAHHTDIKLPVPGGETWYVSQGYNTNPANGGSHYSCNPSTLKDQPSGTVSCSQYWQYKYSLDLHASSGETAGRTVISPVNGTIRWIDESYGGMSIDLGDGYAFAFFHVELASNLAAGQTITQGQFMGTVAAPGNRGNGGYAHIHVTLWSTTDGGNWSRIPQPFTGDHTIDGVNMPALADSSVNQYQGSSITSTNSAGSTPSATVPDVPQLTVPANGTTYTTSPQVVNLAWTAESGATGYQVVINDGAITSPWLTGTTWTTSALSSGQYAWQVRSRNSSGQSALSAKLVFWVDPGTSGGGAPTPGTTVGPLAVTTQAASGVPSLSTYAQGSGMNAGETVDVFWDTASGTKLGTATANSTGNWVAAIQIPESTGGVHKVVAKGKTSAKSASANFTVNPQLIRSPYQAPPGTTISVTIKGFGASEPVNFVFYHTGSSTSTLGSITTNSSGTATITFPMPEATVGPHDYKVTGQTSGISAWGELSIQAAVTLSTSQGATGTSVTATAKGFAGSSSIRFAWNQSTSTQGTTLCSATTSAKGTATCSFTVPSASAGAYPVVAKTADGTTGSAQFGVAGAASITLTPATGTVGAPFQISIGGYQANETVQLIIDGATSAPWQSVQVDATGALLVPSTIPFLTQGSHTIQAKGVSSGKTDSETLTVQPSMSVTPSGGAAGTSVTAYVRGMKANQSLSVRFNSTSGSTGTSVCSGTSDSQGSYTCSFNVPNVSGATYSVYAGSGSTGATTNYAVTTAGEVEGGVVVGLGTYQVTATQEGLVGGTTSNGHVIVPNDHFVALPACTPANCDWLSPGQNHPTYGRVANCTAGVSCYVRVTNPANGECRVEPIWDTGPWFTNDNWWDPAEQRNLNNLSSTVNILPQGYTGADAARDGLNVGYGISNGIGMSNVGYQTGNRAAIDIADGTWQDIGFADGAGPRTVVVSMLWQTGESVDAARQACLGNDDPDPTPTPEAVISINPGFGEASEGVAVSGTGFGAGESVGIYWDTTNSGSPLGTVTASNSGAFSTSVTVPTDDPGKHIIAAKGATTGKKASRTYTVVAAPVVSISPATGPAGTSVAVTGVGYNPSEQVQVYWDSTGSSGTLLTTATATNLGEFTATVTVPSAATGAHLIVGKGVTSGHKPSRTFTLTAPASPTINVSATSGPIGASVTVTGRAYRSGESVDIRWDRSSGTILATTTAGTDGSFSVVVTVPDAELGKHLFVGVGRTSGAKPSRSFTVTEVVTPVVSISVTSGPGGTAVPVTGKGFSPGETVDIRWNSSKGIVLNTVVASNTGTFSTQIAIPDTSPGKYLIVGVGRTSGAKPSRSFTVVDVAPVTPKITLSPVSGRTTTAVTVTGEGFRASESVQIYIDSASSSANLLATATATNTGTLSTTISIPNKVGGEHQIIAKGVTSGVMPSAEFNITQSFSLSASTSAPGSTVRVTLRGYQSAEPIALTWDNVDGQPLGSLTANATGAAAGSFTVPSGVNGAHRIVATGSATAGLNTANFTLTGGSSAAATASASPSSGGTSSAIVVNGANFWSQEQIQVFWDSNTSASGTGTSDFGGAVSVNINVPTFPGGAHTLVVKGVSSGKSATTSFTVQPRLILTPSSGGAGDRIVADVKGWSPGVTATIFFNRSGGSGGTEVCHANGRDSGTASCSFTIPSGFAVGTVVPVTATGTFGTVTTNLTITATTASIASEQAPAATETATATVTASPEASPSAEQTPAASETATPEASGTVEAQPSETATAPAEATEEPTEVETESPTEVATEPPAPTEIPAEEPTEVPTEVVTEAPTEAPTELPTEIPTEIPTEVPTPEPTLAPEPRTVTSYAASDATTFGARPDDVTPGEVLNAGGPEGAIAYITFSVEGIGAGTVTDAYLVLTGGGDAAGGSTIYTIPGFWLDEGSATYNTVPSQGLSPAVDAYGNAAYLPYVGWGEESWINVAGSIYGDGTITFVITGTPDALATLTSRESGVAPRLEITVQD